MWRLLFTGGVPLMATGGPPPEGHGPEIFISMGRMVNGTPDTGMHMNPWQAAVFVLCYLPLVAWGPLLGAVTVRYHRRRVHAVTAVAIR